jgi:hypothetical protein
MGEAKENFDAVVARLTEAGLPIPTPLKGAIAGELDTRERWPAWAQDRLTASNMMFVRAMKAAPKALRLSQSRQPQTAAPAPRRLPEQVASNG